MKLNRHVSAVVLGFGLFSVSLSGYAQGGMGGMGGMGGQAEEVPSQAYLYDDPAFYALNGDGLDGGDESVPGTSRYEDSTLAGSGDCALVLATRVDKPSGTAFLWTPSPRAGDCIDLPFNRTIQINQTGDALACHASSEGPQWPDNPALDFDQDGCVEDVEDAYLRLTMAGVYKSPEEAEAEDALVNIRVLELRRDGDGAVTEVTSGAKFIIEYQNVIPVSVPDPLKPDIRVIDATTFGDATVCEIGPDPDSNKKKPPTVCIDRGDIILPFKVEFHRNPPPPPEP